MPYSGRREGTARHGSGEARERALHRETESTCRERTADKQKATERSVALVRTTGLEPAQPFDHKNLNLTRLPIPPCPHDSDNILSQIQKNANILERFLQKVFAWLGAGEREASVGGRNYRRRKSYAYQKRTVKRIL